MHVSVLGLVLLAGAWAGIQNALAGGGSFVTLGVLVFAGIDPKLANIASTIALFPSQVLSGWAGRGVLGDRTSFPTRAFTLVSLAGGGIGALLLLATSSIVFARLVPWLVLFATAVFAWGSGGGARRLEVARVGPRAGVALQFLIAIYGGYYSGGIGILMLTVLTLMGEGVRAAGARKNILAGVINVAAVLLYLASTRPPWPQTIALGCGAVGGGLLGAWALTRVDERWLRPFVLVIGVGLSIGLFLK